MTPSLPRLASAGMVALALLGSAVPVARAGGAPVWRMAQQDDGQPVDAPEAADSSGLVVRIGRLESQIRTLTGQIEQLQFENRRLETNLQKMQGDVDFRFQDLERPGAARAPVPLKRGDAGTPGPADPTAVATAVPEATPVIPAPAPARPRTPRGGDAFDPNADPSAPGAPRPLGTTEPSPPLARPAAPARSASATGGAPLDLMSRPATDAAAVAAPEVIAAPPAAPRDPNAVASLAPGGTRDEYDADLSLYKAGQLDGAATGFQAFASKYPRDRLTPEAVFLAGESYARLGRHREAAEQFLRVSTDFGKSARAPDALLRLGMSLNALGAKDQACATYLEVSRRYPAAAADVRGGVDRELKRARCPGNG